MPRKAGFFVRCATNSAGTIGQRRASAAPNPIVAVELLENCDVSAMVRHRQPGWVEHHQRTGTAVSGQGITYTVMVTNAGPSDADATSPTRCPARSSARRTPPRKRGASGFTTSGSGSIDDAAVNLPAGSTVTYTISATVIPAATGTLSNTATVTEAAGATASPPISIGWRRGPISKSPRPTTWVGRASPARPARPFRARGSPTRSWPPIPDQRRGRRDYRRPVAQLAHRRDVHRHGKRRRIRLHDQRQRQHRRYGRELPAGSTVTYTLRATINPAATGTLSNTATVTPPAGVTDTNSPGATVNAWARHGTE